MSKFRANENLRSMGAGMLLAMLAWPALGAETATTFVPDFFSGVWGRNSFNFETPPSGPAPLINLRRVGADASRPIVIGDPIPLVGDYNNPILKPEAAEVVKKKGEYSASGHDFPDPSNQCATYSPPYLFTIQLGMQMLQTKDEIVILYNQDNQVRHVRLNDVHPAHVTPTPMGDSVAHYEGDTLVIDTVGVKVQPFTMVDRFGTPQSEALHLIERYRLIDAKEAGEALERQAKTTGGGAVVADPNYRKGLRVELTIEDPNVFTTPWSANVTYTRRPGTWADHLEQVCAENFTDVLHQGFEHVPTADTPDF
jgi:hypothetical protein